MLALLVLSAGEVVSSDRLIEALWGERRPPTAAKMVQVYISRLRKTLNGAPASSSGGLIVTVDHGYMLRVDPEQVDVRAFERLLDRGREAFADHEFDTAATVLRQALGLWRGAPLADFTFDAFAAAEIARLEELRLEALEIRIDADLALGRHAALVAELDTLTTEHPLRERLRAARMLALYRCGREPEALGLYRETRRLLVDELGMEPSPALRELHDAILRQDPALEAPPAPQPPGDAASDPRVRRWRRAAVVAATLALAGGVAAVITLLPKGNAAPVDVAANSVAVIDPSSRRLLKTVVVGTRPGPLAEADGSVWVANLDDNTITGIDATSRKRGATFTPGLPISGMTARGESLWISGASGGLAKVDPTVQAVDEAPIHKRVRPIHSADRGRAAPDRSRCVIGVGRPARRGDALGLDRRASRLARRPRSRRCDRSRRRCDLGQRHGQQRRGKDRGRRRGRPHHDRRRARRAGRRAPSGLGRRALRRQGRAHRPQQRPRHHGDRRRSSAHCAGGHRRLGVGGQQRRRDAV